jgi:hypothetical protein
MVSHATFPTQQGGNANATAALQILRLGAQALPPEYQRYAPVALRFLEDFTRAREVRPLSGPSSGPAAQQPVGPSAPQPSVGPSAQWLSIIDSAMRHRSTGSPSPAAIASIGRALLPAEAGPIIDTALTLITGGGVQAPATTSTRRYVDAILLDPGVSDAETRAIEARRAAITADSATEGLSVAAAELSAAASPQRTRAALARGDSGAGQLGDQMAALHMALAGLADSWSGVRTGATAALTLSTAAQTAAISSVRRVDPGQASPDLTIPARSILRGRP